MTLPVAVGQLVAGATVVEVRRARARLTITVSLDGARQDFALDRAPTRPGPFAALPALTYARGALSFSALAPVGAALAAMLAPHGPAALLATWQDALDGLGDDVDATALLADWLDDAHAVDPRCVAPWTRLEYGTAGQYGPCCTDFQVAPAVDADADPLTLWRSPALRRFRRALADRDPHATCRATCPRLVSASDRPATLVLRGGPPAFRANQRAAIEALLAGDDDVAATPLELVFSATSYCNYDCLMCSHGETGTLADERAPAFYDRLAPLLPGLSRLEVLGGEPLASPVFRAALGSDRFAAAPQLELALTTNGSYLTAAELVRIERVRLAHVTVSLNAATAATYAAVNRGLPWPRVRANLDALLAARAARRNPRALTYSMVILRANLHEVEAFAALAEADDVAVRFMLPMGDRNGQSILTDRAAMTDAAAALARVEARLRARGRDREADRAAGERTILDERLRRGALRALPD